MGSNPEHATVVAAPPIDDCWNRIGVRGDASCPELQQYAHCRNCPVHAAQAAELLKHTPPAGYLAEWTTHFATPKPAVDLDTQSALVFRVNAEWLALSTSVVTEVTGVKPIHSLPHRRNGAVLGLTNVRGELLVCASLGHLIGPTPSAPSKTPEGRSDAARRLLVIRRDDVRAACPVDEVHGVVRFHSRELKDVPATLAKAAVSYSKKQLPLRDRSVGLLDDEIVFAALKRSLA